jgi:hypothetical protein
LVCTTAPDVYLVTALDGTQTCQARYVDNGDGTLTDHQTGLMWEKKSSAGTGDVHDVTNFYTWSSTSTAADGTLFTSFLATLNSDVSVSGTKTCFANHCDWRIPTVNELRSLLTAGYPNCASDPCIDATFGPTLGASYWSSSALASSPLYAWYVHFGVGVVLSIDKIYDNYARAVRGGR